MVKSLEEMKAEFAARGGQVKVAPPAYAYGLVPAEDAQRRAEDEARRAYARTEQQAERMAEQVREARYCGGIRAAMDVLERGGF
jgi:hypothetical protein